MVGAAVVLSLVISGCAASDPGPVQTQTETLPTSIATPTPEPSASATAPEPSFVPDGTAAENLPLFARIVNGVWVGPDNAAGRAYIDALTAAGFDRSAMQVTNDTSTVGNRAESLMFSVLWGDECLIGQVGPATGEPVSVVVPALAEGGCLIGTTRPIDW